MIQSHLLTTEPSTVRFAGATWSLIFDFWAIRKLGQRYAPEATNLDWLKELMAKVAAGDIEAICGCLWAGMLRENPALTFEDVLALLDEASFADLVALPEQILTAMRDAYGAAGQAEEQGEPWDWEVALATWVKEWGRSEEEFWRATFRTFASISNGLAKLYKSTTKTGAGVQAPAEGYNLLDLLTLRGR
ncbi:hypothetical protein [Symbiobacterium thermophilum]|uniref:Uncharacterized protein n=1 Tax=Symbiobacterium thermophilum TaxID=2734 RepID=A0A953LLP7_SYMTR|nr:hypothetical protein [Symbiobacterium thermophilum]MBY6278407.1 hypothetical protein [Symbiobacterium thermophilum]